MRKEIFHKTASPSPLAVFTKAELNTLRVAKLELTRVSLQTSLMSRGNNALWQGLQKRYNLPEEFDFDWNTGGAYKKGILVNQDG
jgi:hypothetical protein